MESILCKRSDVNLNDFGKRNHPKIICSECVIKAIELVEKMKGLLKNDWSI